MYRIAGRFTCIFRGWRYSCITEIIRRLNFSRTPSRTITFTLGFIFRGRKSTVNYNPPAKNTRYTVIACKSEIKSLHVADSKCAKLFSLQSSFGTKLSRSCYTYSRLPQLTCTMMPLFVYSLYRPSVNEFTKLCMWNKTMRIL